MNGDSKKRISLVSKQLLLGTAILFDIVQSIIGLTNLIPVIGQIFSLIGGYIVSFFALLTFGVWFAVLGVNLFQGRKLSKRMASLALEYIPLLNSLPIPGWTLAVWFTIQAAREEDKEKKSQKSNLQLVKGARRKSVVHYNKAA